jgi:hypothetical protein
MIAPIPVHAMFWQASRKVRLGTDAATIADGVAELEMIYCHAQRPKLRDRAKRTLEEFGALVTMGEPA